MRLLAFDTASEACSAAVLDGGRLVSRSEVIGRGHAEALMPMIAAVMAEARVSFDDLERIVVTTGPGSFTGVRVGIAAARGFALVGSVPVVGISTLAAHADRARATHPGEVVLAVLAAGRGELYGAVYAADGTEAVPAAAASAAHFAALVAEGTVLAGSGADAVAELLPGPVAVAHRDTAVDIAVLCRLGARAPEPSAPPRPLYLRPPDAKPQQAARIAHR